MTVDNNKIGRQIEDERELEIAREFLYGLIPEIIKRRKTMHENWLFRGLPDGVPDSEFSIRFVQGMADRMAVSFHKYGLVADAYPSKVDAIASLKKRLELYEGTGNAEWLMDASNFAMIEFMCPRHPSAHFRSTSSDESPGRKIGDNFTKAANTTNDEAARVGGFYKKEGD